MIHPIKNLLEEINTFGNVYTEFKPDAYLTHVQLNKITQYFEDSTRLRTSKLVGAGIACGFKISKKKAPDASDYVELTPGIGITTDGDLLFTDKLKSFTYCKDFTNKMKYARLTASDKEYIYELRTEEDFTSSTGEQRLPLPSNLNDFHLVIFLDSYKEDQELCDAISCDDSGDRVNMVMKFLLVHNAHWHNVLMPDDTIFHEHNIFAFYNSLPTITVKSARLLPNNSSSTLEVYNIFNSKINQWELLRDAYVSILDRFDSRIDFASEGINEVLIEAKFKSTFENLVNRSDIQYLYDHYKDLVETYNQIKQLVLFLNVDCGPAYKAFPKHLCISPLNNPNWEQERHRMYFSSLLKDKKENLRRFKNLMLRFWNQLDTYHVGMESVIRITSSRDYECIIDKRAIPYYYNFNKLNNVWDWNKVLDRTTAMNHAYQNSNNHTQLEIDHLDKDFYRVEGILNKNYYQALKKVNEIKRSQGLAFDVKTVSIGKGLGFTNWDDYECHFADLKTILKSWELDYRCLIKGFEKYFGNLHLITIIDAMKLPNAGPIPASGMNRSTAAASGASERYNISEIYNAEKKESMSRCQINEAITAKYVPREAPQLKVKAMFGSALTIYSHLIGLYDPNRSWADFLKNTYYLDSVVKHIDEFCADRQQLYEIMQDYSNEMMKDNDGENRNLYFFDLFNTYNRLTDVCCYSSKLNWMKEEIASRKQSILEKLTLSFIAEKHSGAVHKGGVGKGETLLLVYNGEIEGTSAFGTNKNSIVADFTLPYMCCSDCAPSQIIQVPIEESVEDLYEISNSETEICEKEDFKIEATRNGESIRLEGKLIIPDLELERTIQSSTNIDFQSILADKDINTVTANFEFPHDLSYSIIVHKTYQAVINYDYNHDKKEFEVTLENPSGQVKLHYQLDDTGDFKTLEGNHLIIPSDDNVKLTIKSINDNPCVEPISEILIAPIREDVYTIDSNIKTICDNETFKIITYKNDVPEALQGEFEIPEISHTDNYFSGDDINLENLLADQDYDGAYVTVNFVFPNELSHSVIVNRSYTPKISYEYHPENNYFWIKILNFRSDLNLQYQVDNSAWVNIRDNSFTVIAESDIQLTIKHKEVMPCFNILKMKLQVNPRDWRNDVIEGIKTIHDNIASSEPRVSAFRESKKRILSIIPEQIENDQNKNMFATGQSLLKLYEDSNSLAERTLVSNGQFFDAELLVYFQSMRLLDDNEFMHYSFPNSLRVLKETIKYKKAFSSEIYSSLNNLSFKSNKPKDILEKYLDLFNLA